MSGMNILLCGVGGQGTVLASKLLARCAIARGEAAHTAETIGMAQRGGCVTSHVRLGDCFSPLIPIGFADAIIAFEPAEAVRTLPFLKRGGVAVVSTDAVKPVTDTLSDSGYGAAQMLAYLKEMPVRLVCVDGAAIAAACGSAKVLNMALLGAAAASGAIGVTPEELERAAGDLNPKFKEANCRAIRMGVLAAGEEP